MYIIYRITNPQNKMIYIGITKSPVKTRWIQHVARANKGASSHLHKAIREYGREHFFIEHICTCKTKEDALLLEQVLIKEYRSIHPFGYNMTTGGEGGSTWNDESIALQSAKISSYFAANPNARIAVSNQVKKTWENPQMRNKYIESAKQRSSTPEQRAELAARAAKGSALRWAKYRASQVTA